MNIELQSMAIEMPQVAAHPNRAPFRGVLTTVDVASDSSPSGANGHRVLLTRAACERALPSLLGVGLDYAPMLDRHDAQRKIGVITEANIVDGRWSTVDGATISRGLTRIHADQTTEENNPRLSAFIRGPSCIEVAGFVYARDFPQIVRTLGKAGITPAEGSRGHSGGGYRYGMSYEIANASVQDVRAAVWIVTEFTFTGAAVLRRDKAAYRATWFELL